MGPGSEDTMKAVSLVGKEKKLEARDIPIPSPGKGEVLVRMLASPINPSDLARIRNIAGPEAATFVPGIEGCGIVSEAGSGILPRLLLGRRVACSSKHKTSGTWAEFMVTSASSCFPLNRKISEEQASMAIVNPLTALAFIDYAEKKKHKALVNTAAGSALGRMLQLLCDRKGIKLINIVRNREQYELLSAERRHYVLASDEADFPGKFRELTRKLSATLLFDAVGGNLGSLMLSELPDNSSYILYGNLSGEKLSVEPQLLITANKRAEGFFLGNWTAEKGMFKTIQNLLRVNRLIKSGMGSPVQAKFRLTRTQEAVDLYLNNMTRGKVLLCPADEI